MKDKFPTSKSDASGLMLGEETVEPGELQRALRSTGWVPDPLCRGQPRLSSAPLWLGPVLCDRLDTAVERIGAAFDELAQLAVAEPAIADRLQMTPWQKLMWLSSDGRWHGFARADMFLCDNGRLVMAELNSDTPTGQNDACAIAGIVDAVVERGRDLMAEYPARFVEMVEDMARPGQTGEGRHPVAIGLVYPTDDPEDIGVIAILRDWLEAAGHRVVLGAPQNLAGGVEGLWLLGQRVDVLLRHYKTDWWSERQTVWRDAPTFRDPAPLSAELTTVLRAVEAGRCAVVNPFGSVLTQNKRAMALLWAHRDRFTDVSRAAIEAHIPETVFLEDIGVERLVAEQDDWVVKSDYGCEGDEVVVGRYVGQAQWAETLGRAIPTRFVAQRYFASSEVPYSSGDGSGWTVNLGVYIVGGRAAGTFGRLSQLHQVSGHGDIVVAARLFPTTTSTHS